MSVKKATLAQPNKLLQRARQERKLSQRELADLIGAPHAFMISRWENGTSFPRLDYRKKLCQIFGKSAEELGLHKETTGPTSIAQKPIYDPDIPLRSFRSQLFVGRDELLAQLKRQLCNEEGSGLAALNGLPGIGKTALAIELLNDPEVRMHFHDGILWATPSLQPQLLALLSHWGDLLGLREPEQPFLQGCDAWAQRLRHIMGTRRMLLVIDDVWSTEDALNCMVGGPCCSYLLTTRIPQVAFHFAREQVLTVPALSVEDSLYLLRQKAPMLSQVEPEILFPLIQAVGGLPLALTLIGDYLAIQTRSRQPRHMQVALRQLQQAEFWLHLQQPQAGPYRDVRLPVGVSLSLQAVIAISTTRLDTRLRAVLSDLSVLPTSPHTFSERMALAVTASRPDDLDSLVDAGLLEYKGQGLYQLHPTIAHYARQQRTNTQAQQRLVEYISTL